MWKERKKYGRKLSKCTKSNLYSTKINTRITVHYHSAARVGCMEGGRLNWPGHCRNVQPVTGLYIVVMVVMVLQALQNVCWILVALICCATHVTHILLSMQPVHREYCSIFDKNADYHLISSNITKTQDNPHPTTVH